MTLKQAHRPLLLRIIDISTTNNRERAMQTTRMIRVTFDKFDVQTINHVRAYLSTVEREGAYLRFCFNADTASIVDASKDTPEALFVVDKGDVVGNNLMGCLDSSDLKLYLISEYVAALEMALTYSKSASGYMFDDCNTHPISVKEYEVDVPVGLMCGLVQPYICEGLIKLF